MRLYSVRMLKNNPLKVRSLGQFCLRRLGTARCLDAVGNDNWDDTDNMVNIALARKILKKRT